MTRKRRIHSFAIFAVGIISTAIASAQNASTYNPTSVGVPPRALVLAQDPFASVNFNACLMTAKAKNNQNTYMMTNLADMFINRSFKLDQSLLNCDETLASIVPTTCSAYEKTSLTGVKKEDDGTGKYEKKIYDQTKADALTLKLEKQNACKKGRNEVATSALDCFSKQFKVLKDSMEEVKKDFEQNIDGMNSYVKAVQAAAETEKTRSAEFEDKQKEFGQTLQQLETVRMSMMGPPDKEGKSGGIANLKAEIKSHDAAKATFQLSLKKEASRRAKSCVADDLVPTFSQIKTGCEGKSVYGCLIDQYRESMLKQYAGAGNVRTNKIDEKKANGAREAFARKLTRVLQALDSGAVTPDQMDSFLAQFELDKYTAQGFAYGTLFKTELKRCLDASQKSVKTDLDTVGTPIYDEKVKIENNESRISGLADTMTKPLGDAVQQAAGLLKIQPNSILNGGDCTVKSVVSQGGVQFKDMAIDKKLSCVQWLNDHLNAMIDGKSSALTKVVETQIGTNWMNQQLKCTGVKGCYSAAKNAQKESEKRLAGLEGKSTFEDPACQGGKCPGIKKFNADSNQNIEKAFRMTAEAFAQRVQLAKAQLDYLEKEFANAGIDFPTIKENEKQPFRCTGEDKICDLPHPFGKELASASGLPLLEPSDFESAKKSAKSKTEELKSDFEKAKQSLASKAEECRKQIKEENKTERSSELAKHKSMFDALMKECQKKGEQSVVASVSSTNEKLKKLRLEEAQLNQMVTSLSISDPEKKLPKVQQQLAAKQAEISALISTIEVNDTEVGKVSDKLEDLLADMQKVCEGSPDCSGEITTIKGSADDCRAMSEAIMKKRGMYDTELMNKFEEQVQAK